MLALQERVEHGRLVIRTRTGFANSPRLGPLAELLAKRSK